jgi:phenylacetate-CoA ligase
MRTIVARATLPAIAALDGMPKLSKEYRDLVANEFCSLDELHGRQVEKLRTLLSHAYEHSPFYRRRFDDAGFDPRTLSRVEDLGKIPTLTKADIRAHGSALLATREPVANLVHSVSGGTTGPSIDLYNDRESLTRKLAAQLRFDSWSGWRPGDWMSVIWPATVDMSHGPPSLLERLKNSLSFRLILLQQAVIDASEFQAHLDEIVRKRATAIRGFPSQVAEMADFCHARGIDLPTVRGIITTGEPLDGSLRARIERGFGRKVFDSYRTREVGCIAQECSEHRGLHVSAETIVLELLPADGHDEAGKIVVTDLTNYCMPFIRYEIGDLGVPANRACPCGRSLPLLESMGGRTTDALYTADGKRVSPISVLPNLFHLLGILNQFRITQDRYDHLLIEMVGEPPEPSLLARQREAIDRIFGANMQVTYSYVERIQPGPSGKFPLIVSKIPPAQ